MKNFRKKSGRKKGKREMTQRYLRNYINIRIISKRVKNEGPNVIIFNEMGLLLISKTRKRTFLQSTELRRKKKQIGIDKQNPQTQNPFQKIFTIKSSTYQRYQITKFTPENHNCSSNIPKNISQTEQKNKRNDQMQLKSDSHASNRGQW